MLVCPYSVARVLYKGGVCFQFYSRYRPKIIPIGIEVSGFDYNHLTGIADIVIIGCADLINLWGLVQPAATTVSVHSASQWTRDDFMGNPPSPDIEVPQSFHAHLMSSLFADNIS